MTEFIVWTICVGASLVALVQAFLFFKGMMRAEEGTPKMIEIAEAVRQGANAYLRQQYKIVTIVFLVITALLAIAAFGFELQSKFVPIAFLSGGFFSGLSGWFGMKTATQASSRTAYAARNSLNQGLQIAFRSGAVMGLTVVGLGLIYITLWFAFLYWGVPAIWGKEKALPLEQITVAMLCFGMGASAQALFARVGGGIFTKAADVGADLVGKVEEHLSEDSPNNPATIADNVGDNVGDVAGMGADLYESYCGSILAASTLGVAAFATTSIFGDQAANVSVHENQLRALLLPMLIAAVGIIASIVGIYFVRTSEDSSQRNLLKALARGIDFSTLLVSISVIGVTYWFMPVVPGTLLFNLVPGIALSVFVGLASGWLIGKWTEYSTSDEFAPTRRLAGQATTGPATIIIGGIAEGMMSTWFPVIVVVAATFAAFGFANGFQFNDSSLFALGLYGVGIAAVGMLSTLGITLATDAYGPIADNAGGNAEMAGLEPAVRQRTDALDSLGNTTAATGKGFAIGSAALTALALLAAYVEEVRVGFEHWGTQAVATQSADGLYRVSEGFVVHKQGDKATGYLAFPAMLADERVRQGWRGIDSSSGVTKIPDEVARVEKVGNEEHVILSASGSRLTELKQASLPDFTSFFDATLMNPRVLAGLFIGGMATFLFCAMTMQAVGRAAQGMVEEVRRQFRENPGILDGRVKPDYARPVQISTLAAQREMIAPSLLGLLIPIVVGLLFGVGGVLGLLCGCLTTGFCLAVFMANSGGAWDNAKKHIEAGHLGGKNSPAHAAAVVGDTVGDPFKDTSGPSLNILIKLMSMVSVVVAGIVVRYSLVALGIL